jgi:hypothetical protein
VHDVLPHAISVLQASGYRLVTLAECLDMPAYQSVGPPESVRLYPELVTLSSLVYLLTGLLDVLNPSPPSL